MKKNEITVPRTARYYSYNLDLPADVLVYVIHGYAQLASEFLKEFSYLENKNIHLVAPEGLSQFYGRERTPVSSWMTSHERETEILDQFNFLEAVQRELSQKHEYQKVYLLAFSQGVSTAMRWMVKSKELKAVELLICSGSIAPELEKSEALLKKVKSCRFYYGDQDGLMKPDHAKIALEKLKDLGLKPAYYPFKGRHEVPEETHQLLSSLV